MPSRAYMKPSRGRSVANEKVSPVDPTGQLPGYEQIDRWLTEAGDEKADRRDLVFMQLGRAKWAIRLFLHGSPEQIDRLRSEFLARQPENE
jgi:hypothetical protein